MAHIDLVKVSINMLEVGPFGCEPRTRELDQQDKGQVSASPSSVLLSPYISWLCIEICSVPRLGDVLEGIPALQAAMHECVTSRHDIRLKEVI